MEWIKLTISILFVLISALPGPNLVLGRNLPQYHKIVKRSPQLQLTVLEDDPTTPRTHPPSPEDLEERRQALLKALAGSGGEGGGAGPASAIGSQVQGLADFGLDLVGGAINNAGEVFGPLRNATKKAREGLPRLGNVINRVVDSKREYRKQISGTLRQTATVTVNNLIRVLTAAGARGTEIFGGVFKLLRTLLDNLTFTISNLVQRMSRGIVNLTRLKGQFLNRNIARAKHALQGGRLLKPVKDVAELGATVARGLAKDFTDAQPWVSESVKTKLALGAKLVPRVRLSSILYPLTEPDCNNQKRESESGESSSSGESNTPAAVDISNDVDVPPDMLELLASVNKEVETETTDTSKSETTEKSESNDILEPSASGKTETKQAIDAPPANTVSSSTTTTTELPKSEITTTSGSTSTTNTTTSTTTTTEPAKSETTSTTTTEKPQSTDFSTSPSNDSTNSDKTTKSATESEVTSTTISSISLDDLFGIGSKSTSAKPT